MGSLSGARADGRALSSMWPFLLTLLGICCKKVWCITSARGSGVVEGKNGEDASSDKISLRRVRSARGDCCKHAGIVPFSGEARLPATAITTSVGVAIGFEMYLCLWNTVAGTLVARVFNIQKVHAQ